jgi:phosphohistidine swiveling domain-containing protein
LAAHFARTVAGMERLWDIHMLVMFPAYTAISQFDDLYRDLFGAGGGPAADPGQPFGAYRLLQGFDNKTLEADRALWQLSRRALAVPEVRRVLASGPAAGVAAALEACAGGPPFLGELRAFLRTYGERGDKWGLSHPYWIEDPSPAIENLRDYVAQPDRDPAAERAALAAERERLVARARARLRGRPRPVVQDFEFLLGAAQQANVLTEDHGFWIDSRGGYQVRRVLLELGRRFAHAGTLAAPDEVFLLTPDEVRETAAAAARLDRRRLVAGRRAELAYFRTIAPPPALGTPSPSDAAPDEPVLRMLGRFFGAPPESAAGADVVRGTAGSPGVARGPAKVLRSLAEAAKLRPGDVLVAETTAPPWTCLFATAAAIVTDAGGILSHCAVVAREYGIPAVVGTGTGTTAIADGRWLEVDGDAGVVRLL